MRTPLLAALVFLASVMTSTAAPLNSEGGPLSRTQHGALPQQPTTQESGAFGFGAPSLKNVFGPNIGP